jgi:hypothetical protein
MPKLPAYAHKHKVHKDSTHFTIRLRRSTVHRAMTAAAMIIVALTIVLPNFNSFKLNDVQHTQMASSESLKTLFTAITPMQAVESEQTSVIESESVAEQDVTSELVTSEQVEISPIASDATSNEGVAEAIEDNSQNAETDISARSLEVKGYCVVMASAITNRGADLLIEKLNKEGFSNAVKYNDNGMLRVVLTGYAGEKEARAEIAVVRTVDKMYSGSWLKHF